MIEQLAVLVYGVLTMVFAAILASMTQSPVAMVLVIAAAGLTYLYQFFQLLDDMKPGVLFIMQLAVIALTFASVTVSLLGSF